MRITINCDLGEGFGRWDLTPDEQLLQYIDAANIACGFHAGDPPRIAATVQSAVAADVSVGAHPSYPDRQGFGRRRMDMAPAELRDFVTYQIGALQAFARAAGGKVEHVKMHGALYNFASVDEQAAAAVVEGSLRADPALIIVALSESVLEEVARAKGARVAREAFADRAYDRDGQLVSRKQPGSVLTDVNEIARQVANIVQKQRVQAITGEWIPLAADTVCIHGDTTGAVDIARQLRNALAEQGVSFNTFSKSVA